MDDSSLRKLQLFELGILKDIDKVCKKNNIRYFLYAGTCLGAVRHKGFIPWDDDIDIAMHVADYVRFLEISQKELGEEYFLQTHDTDPDYPFMFAKIRKNHTTMIPSWKKDYSGHHGIWVDINPLIYVSSKLDFRLKRYMITYTNMLCLNGPVYLSEKKWKKQQKKYIPYLLLLSTRLFSPKMRNMLAAKIRNRLLFAKEQQYMSGVWGTITSYAPAKAYQGDPVILPFEDGLFPVPPDYDAALTGWYGDYMTPPPPEQQVSKHGDLFIDYEHSWDELDHASVNF